MKLIIILLFLITQNKKKKGIRRKKVNRKIYYIMGSCIFVVRLDAITLALDDQLDFVFSRTKLISKYRSVNNLS